MTLFRVTITKTAFSVVPIIRTFELLEHSGANAVNTVRRVFDFKEPEWEAYAVTLLYPNQIFETTDGKRL